MLQIRSIQVRHAAKRLHGGAALGRHGHWGVEEEAIVAQTEHRHRGSERHAENAHRLAVEPNALGERSKHSIGTHAQSGS